MLVAGIPLPRHGFRHLSSPQPCFTFPPRTDFQIVPESAASSYSVGSFQISVKQDLAEIRRIETSLPQREFLPPTFAASRKGHRPVRAKSVFSSGNRDSCGRTVLAANRDKCGGRRVKFVN